VHELKPTDYGRARALYEPLTFMPFCAAVLEGSHEGRVLVDDLDRPGTAFMLTWECWGYLAGDPSNEAFLRDLNEALFAKTFLGEHAWGLLLNCPPDGWREGLETVCAPHPPTEFPRKHYVAHKMSGDWQTCIPKGYALQRMDRSLLDLPGSLPDDVTRMVESIDWDADTVAKGCGFVALCGDEIVAWSMIDCVVGDVGEIGLYTQAPHRRRGLATATSAATIAYGLEHGLTGVVWDCYLYNAGSVRTAERLGLVHERDHTMYCLHLNENNHWAMLAWHQADGGNYQRTLDTCERLSAQQAQVPELVYVAAARAWAATGAPDKALAQLDRAVDAGWNYAPDLACVEFDGLRDTPQWQTLLARLGT